jgi:hypothetical protein
MKTILCALLILAGFTAVSAQETIVQKAQFEQILKNSTEIMKSKPHRVIVVSETNVNGKPQETTSAKTVVEVVGNDKRRAVREYKSQNQNKKREFIQVGNKVYSRENEGQWTQSGMPNNPAEGNLKIVDEKVEYKSLGSESLNGANANVYTRTRERKMTDSSNNEEVQSTETVKYWFDQNGALLKREMERENRRSGKIFHFKVTATINFDDSIQVVAPQVAGNK